MTPLTTRARELAARERKLYDQRTIPAVLEELADEVERLTESEAELSRLFEMQFDADVRAVKEWRDKNPGNDLVWPDSTRLAVWALEQRDVAAAEAANSAAQRDEVVLRATQAEEWVATLAARYATLKGYSSASDRLLKSARDELSRIRNTTTKGQAI